MQQELTQFEIRMNNMANEIKNLGEKQEQTNKAINEMRTDLNKFIEKAENRFAGKWTEKVLVFVGIGIGTAILAALMAGLLK